MGVRCRDLIGFGDLPVLLRMLRAAVLTVVDLDALAMV
jgi:hypothetical protein